VDVSPSLTDRFGSSFLKLFLKWSYQVNRLKSFLKAEDGAELAEYAVGTAILVAIAIVVYAVLGDAVNNKMNAVANEVDAPPPGP
jgi:Flp pilus assembly pilin Flp